MSEKQWAHWTLSKPRPKLLDLFCCEGGASVGYSRAGFDVYGVDLFEDYSQKRYPFPSVRADALVALRVLLAGAGVPFTHKDGTVEHLSGEDFSAFAASPPCQRHTAGTRAIDRGRYPDLIGPTRELLEASGLPYIIENVPGAPLENAVTLCGTMFSLCAIDDDGTNLELRRHRLFESNIPLFSRDCQHGWFSEQVAGVYGGARRDKDEARNVRHGGYVPQNKVVAQALLGVDWMTWKGMQQCIPPAYTKFLGTQLLAHIEGQVAA